MQMIRKGHRWLAPLFVVVLIIVAATNGFPSPDVINPVLRVQVGLMILLTISGVVLFVYPFIAKARRK